MPKRGVHQGSELGPVLYILFTSDFPRYLNEYCNSLMYADDTVILLSGCNPGQLEISAYAALLLGRKKLVYKLPELEDILRLLKISENS